MEEIFKWAAAAENKDKTFKPKTSYNTGDTFICGGTDTTVSIGSTLTLTFNTGVYGQFKEHVNGNLRFLYWYNVTPTEETWKKYLGG